MKISILPEQPSPENEICKKCKLFEACGNPFQQGVYLTKDNQWACGIPDFTPDGGWLAVLADPLTRSVEIGGILQEPGLDLVFQVANELGVAHRIWYHPGMKCRSVVYAQSAQERKTLPLEQWTVREQKLTFNVYRKCWGHILSDVMKLDPAAVLVLGKEAAKMILDRSDIHTMLDQRHVWDVEVELHEEVQKRSYPVFPCFPTEYVLTDLPNRREPFRVKFQKILNRIEKPVKLKIFTEEFDKQYVCGLKPEVAREWFDKVRADLDRPLAWDIESKGLEMWSNDFKLGIFSFHHPIHEHPLIVCSNDYLFSDRLLEHHFPKEGKNFGIYEPELMHIVQDVLEDENIKKIGHNTQFDMVATNAWSKRRYGSPWQIKGFYSDTLMLEYLLTADASSGRALDDLVRKYLIGTPEYWREIEEFRAENPAYGFDYTIYPMEIVIPYAACDTKVVTYIFNKQVKEFDRIGQAFGGRYVTNRGPEEQAKATYSMKDYAFHARKIHYLFCTHLQTIGQGVDHELVPTIAKWYKDEQERICKSFTDHPEVVEFEKTKLIDVYAENSKTRKDMEKGFASDPDFHPRMSWGSPAAVQALFYKHLKLEVPGYTDSGTPSTDRAALTSLASHQNNDIAKALLEHRAVTKVVSSFINPVLGIDKHGNKAKTRVVWDDKLIHASFKPGATRTGRLACSLPNLQQLSRDGLVKKMYSSRWKDGWIMQRDYSGLEVRLLACLSRDAKLLDDFINGRDPHFRTQQYFFGDKADKHNKSQRSICKQVLFGRVYGQGDNGLYELLRAKGVKSPFTGKDVTLEECQKMNKMLDDLYPGVAEWVQLAHGQAVLEKHVCSAFGFVRPLWIMDSVQYYFEQLKKNNTTKRFKLLRAEINEALRRAQNTPIQSAAGDLTVFAGWKIKMELEKEGLQSQICSNVHDSLWVDIPCDDEVMPVARIMHEVMDNVPSWIGELLPGYDASWMCIPIIGENELGLNAKDTVVLSKEPTSSDMAMEFQLNNDWVEKLDWGKTFASSIYSTMNSETKKAKYFLPWKGNSTEIKNMLRKMRTALK